jgi:2-(1,2-epoxy-1,2-dihydrophenyl)acetyl-CoA isomerase
MSEPFTSILCETVGKVAVIAYNRLERRNAWSVTCVRETIAALRAANADPEVGAIVLTGEGATYCGGADLKEGKEYDSKTGQRLTAASFTMGAGDNNWLAILSRSKPVVAAINGPAVGIGATHALAADIRVAARSASFSFPFLRLGAMPECGSTALLARLIGTGRATEVLLRSASVSADEALAWGLVTHVFADAELRSRAIEIASEIAELPALQVSLTKRLLAENAESGDVEAIMRTESRAFIELFKTLKREKAL